MTDGLARVMSGSAKISSGIMKGKPEFERRNKSWKTK